MAPVKENLSERNANALLEAVKNEHPTLIVEAMTATAAVGNGENMMGVVTRVEVVGHDLDTGDKVTLSLIMKTPPESAERRELFLCDAAFHNEAVFYGEVAPMLGYSLKLPFPPCLLASDDVIVLRDLRQDGFTMADRRAGLDLDHCLLVMKELGKYHALSYSMKHLKPELFHKLSSSVTEVFIHKGNTLLIQCIDFCIDMAVKASKNPDTTVVDKLKSFRGKGMDVLIPHVSPVEPLAVICHGDFHSNNILFCYANNNGTPTEVGFVDLQGCRYASPALDILYFIFSSGSSDVLKHHFKSLISSYQTSLNDRLATLAPIAKAPSLDEVMAELKMRLDYGLIMSLMMLPIVVSDKLNFDLDTTSLENLDQAKQEMETGRNDEAYERRINDLFYLITEENLVGKS